MPTMEGFTEIHEDLFSWRLDYDIANNLGDWPIYSELDNITKTHAQ